MPPDLLRPPAEAGISDPRGVAAELAAADAGRPYTELCRADAALDTPPAAVAGRAGIAPPRVVLFEEPRLATRGSDCTLRDTPAEPSIDARVSTSEERTSTE